MSDNIYQSPQAENLTSEVAEELPDFINPWKSIWTQPRLTIRYLIARNPEYMVILLAVISGVYNAINQASTNAKGDEQSLGFVLGTSLVGGTFGGIIGLYLISWLQKVTGRWLGGVADSVQIRVAYAWSSLPGLLGIPFLILQLFMFGNDIFTTEMTSIFESRQNQVLFYGMSIMEMGLGLWGVIWHLICLSEVHKFSVWRALGTMLLTVLLIALPFVLLGYFSVMLFT